MRQPKTFAMRNAVFLLTLPLMACAGLSGVPSLAPRPIEKADSASTATPAPFVSAPADAALATRIATLLLEAREGDAVFQREDRAGSTAISAGRRAAEGSEAWIAGEIARSALEVARQRSGDALAALDQLLVERTTANGSGLVEIAAAKDQAEAIVAQQTQRLDALTR